ncbi:thioredoxin family protein [Modestobacter sp. Leaf380]|uniref:thioredoxin family protein n=1 Tax=Modestobacter sp. Leaf380 TaxID=1736356 RepID=UPI000A45D5DA|nr:thioredoxin family protein [Modestobacter sp. Leaf380]
METTGLVVLLVALALTGLAAWWLRTRSGAVRRPAEEEADVTGSRDTEVLRSLGVRPEDADLTVVQFATAFCAPCRATKARLAQLQTTRPGLAAVHVDAESQLEAVRALDVRRTPTLFYLDRSGRVLGRSSGAPRPDELTAIVDAHAPAVRTS